MDNHLGTEQEETKDSVELRQVIIEIKEIPKLSWPSLGPGSLELSWNGGRLSVLPDRRPSNLPIPNFQQHTNGPAPRLTSKRCCNLVGPDWSSVGDYISEILGGGRLSLHPARGHNNATYTQFHQHMYNPDVPHHA